MKIRKECELFQIIPKEKLDYLFKHSDAGAEMNSEFLGFEDIYKKALEYTSSDMVIIDLGCAYATQSWYFKDYAQYIGIDAFGDNNSVIHTENSEYYFTSIQNFVEEILPTLDIDLNNVFAICSAVPDNEARKIVRETFPNYLDWYPEEELVICQNEKVAVEPELKSDDIFLSM